MGGADLGSYSQKQLVDKIMAPCPEAEVLLGDVKTQCLIDTGAEVSTLTEEYFRKYLAPQGQEPLDTSPWLRITAANGSAIPYLGYVEVDVTVCGHTFPNMGFLVSTSFSDDAADSTKRYRKKVPAIMGNNILRHVHDYRRAQHGCHNSSGPQREQEPWAGWDTLCPLGDSAWSTTGSDGQVGFVKLARKTPVCVPAGSIKHVDGRANPLNGKYTAMVDRVQAEQGPLPRGLLVVPSFSKVSSGQVTVSVANMSNEDIWLKPKTRLGVLTAVQEVDESLDRDVPVSFASSREVVLGKKDERDIYHGESVGKFPEGLEVDLSGMNSDQREAIHVLLYKHNHVFGHDENDMGFNEDEPHRIPTVDDNPVILPHRRIPPHLQPEVKEYLQRWLRQGIIEPSTSSYASQAVLVRKKCGGLRICVDYRALNAKTQKDAYPLPRIEESLEALKGAKYFSSLDLVQGFLQCALDPKDAHKTAFRVGTGGLYQFKRMPFGLCNAPGSFQRLMEKILGDQAFETLLIFMDDLLVYASTVEGMIERLDLVFTRLENFGLKLKSQKCHLFKRVIKYLGHVVSENGIEVDPEKTSAITDWKIPTTVHELRSFLGLASYYRRFVAGFASIAAPLNALLGKATKGKRNEHFKEPWSEECTKAFNRLKTALTTAPVLGFPDFQRPFIVETDASFHGLGGVLSQDQENGRVVICYASRSLKPAERNMDNYSATKLELLALKWVITEKFRDYLLGGTFTVYTDNNPRHTCRRQSLGPLKCAGFRNLHSLTSISNIEVEKQTRMLTP